MIEQVRRALCAATLLSGCSALLFLVLPLAVHALVEVAIAGGSIHLLWPLAALMGVIVAGGVLIDAARNRILLRSSLWLDHKLGQLILAGRPAGGERETRIERDRRALAAVRVELASGATASRQDALWLPPAFLLALVIDPVLGGAAAAIAALIALTALAGRRLVAAPLAQGEQAAGISRGHWRTAAAAGPPALTANAGKRWERTHRAQVAADYVLGKRAAAVAMLGQGLALAGLLAAMLLAAWLVVNHAVAAGAVAAVGLVLVRSLTLLVRQTGLSQQLAAGRAGWRHVMSAGERPGLQATRERSGPGRIVLESASYRHSARAPTALSSISLVLEPGECLGITGPGGAGKSTLAGLLAGALAPSSGSARLDGDDLADLAWREGTPLIGYLADEPRIVDASVLDNIASLADPDRAEAMRAAQRAGVATIIEGLPRGLDTLAGPGGAGLSGSERRAVALARAFYGTPQLIVLDEPERGLDEAEINALAEGLEAVREGGATLAIATRSERLLRLADTVVVLDRGMVEAYGEAGQIVSGMARLEQGLPAAPTSHVLH